jgi:hypothetical protein
MARSTRPTRGARGSQPSAFAGRVSWPLATKARSSRWRATTRGSSTWRAGWPCPASSTCTITSSRARAARCSNSPCLPPCQSRPLWRPSARQATKHRLANGFRGLAGDRQSRKGLRPPRASKPSMPSARAILSCSATSASFARRQQPRDRRGGTWPHRGRCLLPARGRARRSRQAHGPAP